MRTKIITLLALSMLAISCGPSKDKLLKQKIQGLTEMAELGTVEYTVRKIIKSDDSRVTLGDKLKVGDRKCVFSCFAYLKAGIDLKNFSADKVILDKENNSISVTFPKATLLSFNIPPDQIVEEFEISTKLRDPFTVEQKMQLLQMGEADIKADIESLGILADAEANAAYFFKAMLANFGFSSINIAFE